MIYRNENVPYAFFHNPRTSGTNIGHYLETACGGRICSNTCTPALHHSIYAAEIKHKDLSNFYKFGFVRNPYSRDYSLYTLYCQTFNTDMSFKHWILERYSNYEARDSQNFKLPQYGYFCDEVGVLQVNVFRFEERDSALQEVASVIGANAEDLISNRPKYSLGQFRYNSVRRGPIDDYKKYYDYELYEFVTPFHQLDLDAFGYTFDGFKPSKSVDFKFEGHPDFYNHDYVNPEHLNGAYINV